MPKRVRLQRTDNGTTPDWPAYQAKSLQWERWGLLATLTPLAAVVLMIWKPAAL